MPLSEEMKKEMRAIRRKDEIILDATDQIKDATDSILKIEECFNLADSWLKPRGEKLDRKKVIEVNTGIFRNQDREIVKCIYVGTNEGKFCITEDSRIIVISNPKYGKLKVEYII